MKHFDLFKSESLKMTLDETERENMKESLLAYMEKNPIHEPAHSEKTHNNQKSLTKILAFIVICLIIGIGVVMFLRK
jgi:uncharacterized protein HemX